MQFASFRSNIRVRRYSQAIRDVLIDETEVTALVTSDEKPHILFQWRYCRKEELEIRKLIPPPKTKEEEGEEDLNPFAASTSHAVPGRVTAENAHICVRI